MSIIQKRDGDEFRCVVIYGQQRYVAQKIQHELIEYVHGHVVVVEEIPSAIVHYNFFKRKELHCHKHFQGEAFHTWWKLYTPKAAGFGGNAVVPVLS